MKAGLQPISRDMYKPLRLNLRIRRWIDQMYYIILIYKNIWYHTPDTVSAGFRGPNTKEGSRLDFVIDCHVEQTWQAIIS